MTAKIKSSMLTIAFTLITALGAATPPVQDRPADTMKSIEEKIKSDKRSLIAENMELTESEGEEFWPLYESYQRDLEGLAERTRKLIDEYAESFDTLSDKAAGRLMEDYVLIERDRQRYREYYLSRFRDVLPYKKVVRYYQLESKIQAVIQYELASKIPLVR